MKKLFLVLGLVALAFVTSYADPHGIDTEDNDFAEFEDFDDEG